MLALEQELASHGISSPELAEEFRKLSVEQAGIWGVRRFSSIIPLRKIRSRFFYVLPGVHIPEMLSTCCFPFFQKPHIAKFLWSLWILPRCSCSFVRPQYFDLTCFLTFLLRKSFCSREKNQTWSTTNHSVSLPSFNKCKCPFRASNIIGGTKIGSKLHCFLSSWTVLSVSILPEFRWLDIRMAATQRLWLSVKDRRKLCLVCRAGMEDQGWSPEGGSNYIFHLFHPLLVYQNPTHSGSYLDSKVFAGE